MFRATTIQGQRLAVIIQCCHMIVIRAYLVVARSELAVIIQCCHMIVIRAYGQS